MSDLPDPPEQLPANILFLKRLVTVLTATMIAGLLAIFTLLVIRLSSEPRVLPDSITLPDGVTAVAFTQGTDWYAVVTGDDRILIFDRGSGALRQTVEITR